MEFFNAEDAEITPRAQRFISYFLCVLGANSVFSAFNRPMLLSTLPSRNGNDDR